MASQEPDAVAEANGVQQHTLASTCAQVTRNGNPPYMILTMIMISQIWYI